MRICCEQGNLNHEDDGRLDDDDGHILFSSLPHRHPDPDHDDVVVDDYSRCCYCLLLLLSSGE